MNQYVDSSSWDNFIAGRLEILEELASPVVHSFQQHDSVDAGSPMFDGSWDWHSAIQAAFSLHVLYRETRDPKYIDVINFKIDPGKVQDLVHAELEYMRSEKESNLYGLSHLLALVRERERVLDRKDLEPLAKEAVFLIRRHLDAMSGKEVTERLLGDAYGNLAWNLIHLKLWADHSKDSKLQSYVGKLSRVLRNSNLDKLLPVRGDLLPDREEFFPPSLMRLAAVCQISEDEPQEIGDWVRDRLPDDLWIEPVTEPKTVHAAGLNFSRAYCLWHIYRATGNITHRNNFASLVSYHVRRHELWMIDYYSHSHWVPQFGIRAISAVDEIWCFCRISSETLLRCQRA